MLHEIECPLGFRPAIAALWLHHHPYVVARADCQSDCIYNLTSRQDCGVGP
jgi:hypothetical protein